MEHRDRNGDEKGCPEQIRRKVEFGPGWAGYAACRPQGNGYSRSLSAFDRPVRFEGEVVKRIHMLTLLSVLAVALSVGLLPGVANANGGRGSTTQVPIQPQ